MGGNCHRKVSQLLLNGFGSFGRLRGILAALDQWPQREMYP
jgi:hypothetical protein